LGRWSQRENGRVAANTSVSPERDASRCRRGRFFSAIVYVLRTGCQWKALPKEYGSASAVHAHFQRWQREGFF